MLATPNSRLLSCFDFWQRTRCKCPNTGSWINRGTVGAIDVGSASIGIAVSDDYQQTAIPLFSLKRHTDHTFSQESESLLQKEIKERSVRGFIVGRSQPEGSSTYQDSFLTNFLAHPLAESCDLVFTQWDEAFSTEIAKALLLRMGLDAEPSLFGKMPRRAPKKVQTAIDHLAASVILQEYLGRVSNLVSE